MTIPTWLLILLLSITAGCAVQPGKYNGPEIPVREVVISWP